MLIKKLLFSFFALCTHKPPAVPILPPKYTSPAPVQQPGLTSVTTISAATVPTAEDVLASLTTASASLSALESRLMYYSYVGGFQPTAADAQALHAVLALPAPGFQADASPNAARWLRSVQSFTAAETAEWK